VVNIQDDEIVSITETTIDSIITYTDYTTMKRKTWNLEDAGWKRG
jgi:hypothetical protein